MTLNAVVNKKTGIVAHAQYKNAVRVQLLNDSRDTVVSYG
jgi:hypothetical protein